MKTDMEKLQRMIDYHFKNMALLKEALTHRSFATENNLKYDNQRLEFLGDTVLQILLTVYLYDKYPQYQEGDLTKIRSAMANQTSLAKLARTIGLGEELMLGHGEIEAHGAARDSTVSDAFEALFAAIMLDSDLETTRKIFLKILLNVFPEPANQLYQLNPKGMLQELCQSNFGLHPQYRVVGIDGPAHNPSFTVEAHLGNQILGRASAGKRKTAESIVAQEIIDKVLSSQINMAELKQKLSERE